MIKLEKYSSLKGKIRMAKPNEAALVIGLQFGSITPFFPQNKHSVELYLDRSVEKLSKINIGSGKQSIGYEMNVIDLLAVWPGTVANIAIEHC